MAVVTDAEPVQMSDPGRILAQSAQPPAANAASAIPLSQFLAQQLGSQSGGGADPDEAQFQQWYAGWAAKAGLDPNPDAPDHKYDYRAAFRAGVVPQIDPSDGRYHWDSRFKADDHPNRFIDGVDTKTGGPAPKLSDGVR